MGHYLTIIGTKAMQTETLQFPSTGFMRIKQVLQFVPTSRTTLWRWVKEGKFPTPLRLSEAMTVWKAEDVKNWIDQQGKEEQAA